MPTLYLVGTPIGNLEDITFRAVRTLREVGVVAAEDTRVTGRLLKHYEIDTRLISYHEHSSGQRIEQLVETLQTQDVALVSDAGMPALSDPGYRLVRAALDAGIDVVPIPGPTAAVSALISSGLPTDQFLFMGFMPRQSSGRQKALVEVAQMPATLLFYESPHRVVALLRDLLEVLGNRPVAIGRELTKLYEEIWRGTVADGIAEFEARAQIKGEITVVVGGKPQRTGRWEESEVLDQLRQQIEQGIPRKKAAADIAKESGWRKREIYALSLDESTP